MTNTNTFTAAQVRNAKAQADKAVDTYDTAMNNKTVVVIMSATGKALCSIISLKYPSVFVRFYGLGITRGRAGGSGYDRFSASVDNAFNTLQAAEGTAPEGKRDNFQEERKALNDMAQVLNNRDGTKALVALQAAGFQVMSII